MLFFISLGFEVLENAFSVIFLHRVAICGRHWIAFLQLPFGYIISIGAALFTTTIVLADLMSMGTSQLVLFGYSWPLIEFSHFLIYVAGAIVEILCISAIYYFMPTGRLSVQHALIGGTTAGLLWEIVRHALGWYFGTLSQVNLV